MGEKGRTNREKRRNNYKLKGREDIPEREKEKQKENDRTYRMKFTDDNNNPTEKNKNIWASEWID